MSQNGIHRDGELTGSRVITGAVFLAGCVVLGLGIGLIVEQPAFGVMLAVGGWLVAISLVRIARGS